MLLKKAEIEVRGRTVDVWYLMTEQDGKNASRAEKGPIASGMEARWREQVKHDEAKKPGMGSFAMERMKYWTTIADEHWSKACNDVVSGLHVLDAFCVIPSTREERRDPLVDALRKQFPHAIELTYTRPPGFHFGHKREDEIFHALKHADQEMLLTAACVAVADDRAGNGTTLRATIRRILTDQGS